MIIEKSCETCAYGSYASSVCAVCIEDYNNLPYYRPAPKFQPPLPAETHDPVLSPKHYQLLPEVEVKDIRKVLLGKIEANNSLTYHQADLWSRAWEYLTRFMDKNGQEDLEKAQVYLGWLVDDLKSQKGE